MDRKVLWEATKEPLRLLVLAVIPFIIAYTQELPYEWAAIATLILKGVDKFLHELGKAEKQDSLVRGLTRF